MESRERKRYDVIGKLGILNYSNGDKYDGDLKDGKKNGRGKSEIIIIGTMNFANGDKYEGDWVDDKKEGTGIS